MEEMLLEASLRKAAQRAWRGFGRWVDYGDAEGEMWLWYYSKGHELEPEQAVMRAWRVVRGYCQHEKATVLGYSHSDVYYYTRSMVETLIPQALQSGVPETKIRDDQPKALRPAGESGDLAAYVMDVRQALADLPAEDRQLVAVLAQTQDYTSTASEMAVDERTVRRRYVRCLDAMVDTLGGVKP